MTQQVGTRASLRLNGEESTCQCMRHGFDLPQAEMATHSRILAWEIPWTKEPGRLQSMGSQRVGHDSPNNQEQVGTRTPIQIWGALIFLTLKGSLQKRLRGRIDLDQESATYSPWTKSHLRPAFVQTLKGFFIVKYWGKSEESSFMTHENYMKLKFQHKLSFIGTQPLPFICILSPGCF